MYFIYNEYSCIDALKEAGFDIDEIKKYLCQDEIDVLQNDLYAATEDRDYYEALVEDKTSEILDMLEFLYEIKDDLIKGSMTKIKLVEKIRAFLEDL